MMMASSRVWKRKKKRLLKKGLNYARTHGLKKAVRRVKMELKPGSIDYAQWIAKHEQIDVAAQKTKAQAFGYRPLISVVMPVYNVEIKWLEKCIDSVIAQTYDHWELCISDDASTDPKIHKCLERYQQKKTHGSKLFFVKKTGISV